MLRNVADYTAFLKEELDGINTAQETETSTKWTRSAALKNRTKLISRPRRIPSRSQLQEWMQRVTLSSVDGRFTF